MRNSSPQESLPRSVLLAFAPMHKRAFGLALGLASGLSIFLATLVYLARNPGHGANLWLLAQYFRGYRVSVGGAVIGFGWGMFVGFIAGWFLAFVRNLSLAVSVFLIRTKAEMRQTSDFLDHI
jgi:hypothetical protein